VLALLNEPQVQSPSISDHSVWILLYGFISMKNMPTLLDVLNNYKCTKMGIPIVGVGITYVANHES